MEPVTRSISLDDKIRRKLIVDATVDSQNALSKVGLMPASADVAAKEEAESLRRIDNIASLVPVLQVFSNWLTHLALASDVAGVQSMEEEHQQYFVNILQSVTMSSLVSTISLLVDMGVLAPAPIVVGETNG